MGLAVTRSRALAGVEAPEVTVEVHLPDGQPTFTIVGIADTEVRKSRERVRAALNNRGFAFPASRLTVNLASADLPKESASFALPIAIGILAASGQLLATALDHYEFAGELRPVRTARDPRFHPAARHRGRGGAGAGPAHPRRRFPVAAGGPSGCRRRCGDAA